MLASFLASLQNLEFFTAFRESAWVYPIVLSTHLACIAVFGGLILVTDLRLLGLTLREVPVSDVINRLRIWKWLGFIIMIACGLMLACCKAVTYSTNPYFQLKLTLLLLIAANALVFRRSVYRNTAELDRVKVMPGRAKLAASLSLILWIGVLSAGRWIAYFEPPCAPGQNTGGCVQQYPLKAPGRN